MSHLAVLAVALIAALLQVGVLPELQSDPLARPLLPVALIGGWCAMRGPAQTWSVLVATPLVAGSLSEERTGWFLLALLPAAALGAALAAHVDPQRPPGLARRVAAAAVVAAAGAALHVAILALAGGATADAGAWMGGIAAAAGWTALLAALVALVLWPLRPQPKGLFA